MPRTPHPHPPLSKYFNLSFSLLTLHSLCKPLPYLIELRLLCYTNRYLNLTLTLNLSGTLAVAQRAICPKASMRENTATQYSVEDHLKTFLTIIFHALTWCINMV